MFHKATLFLFILTCSLISTAQESYYHYFIYLKDKLNSGFSTEHPEQYLSTKALERRAKFHINVTEEDFPLDRSYMQAIAGITDCEIRNQSKWLNAVEVRFKDPLVLDKITSFPFVKSALFLGKIKPGVAPERKKIDEKYLLPKQSDSTNEIYIFTKKDYGDAYLQNSLINIPLLHNNQYTGRGISIAVFDAGFSNVYKTPGMNFDLSKVVVRDFVTHDNSVWEDDRHGANVLSFMKTHHPGTYIGTAPMADYILLRTEESSTEYPTEEINWLAAAEFADSMGVDLISSSLGYSAFDDTSLSHKHEDLDGKTSIIAKAANIAHSKGIFIVVSAGNDGESKWHAIGTPSDATGVITIGATDAEGTHAEFSSYGPSADGRTKPDFVVMGKKAVVASETGCYTGNGTSYSTPIFAGALACLMQACPDKKYSEFIEALKQSATHYTKPDSAYGYGIPDMGLAAAILGNFMGADTSADILWQNTDGSYWEDQCVHFRSSKDQTISVKISGIKIKRHKKKALSEKKYSVAKGGWVHDYELHSLLTELIKKKKYGEVILEVITPNATYQRVFTLQ